MPRDDQAADGGGRIEDMLAELAAIDPERFERVCTELLRILRAVKSSHTKG